MWTVRENLGRNFLRIPTPVYKKNIYEKFAWCPDHSCLYPWSEMILSTGKQPKTNCWVRDMSPTRTLFENRVFALTKNHFWSRAAETKLPALSKLWQTGQPTNQPTRRDDATDSFTSKIKETYIRIQFKYETIRM